MKLDPSRPIFYFRTCFFKYKTTKGMKDLDFWCPLIFQSRTLFAVEFFNAYGLRITHSTYNMYFLKLKSGGQSDEKLWIGSLLYKESLWQLTIWFDPKSKPNFIILYLFQWCYSKALIESANNSFYYLDNFGSIPC